MSIPVQIHFNADKTRISSCYSLIISRHAVDLSSTYYRLRWSIPQRFLGRTKTVDDAKGMRKDGQ